MKATLLLIFISSLNCFAQNIAFDHIEYKTNCNNAYVMTLEHYSSDSAVLELKRIERYYGFLYGEEYFLLAYNYSKLGKNRKAAQSLKKAWSNYFFDFNVVWESDSLQPMLIMRNFNKNQKRIVAQGHKKFAELKTAYSDSLNSVILSLDSIDQKLRMDLNYDSISIEDILILDSVNIRGFQKFIRKHGYPGERLLPGYGNPAFTLLIHSSYYLWFFDDMKDELFEQVRLGNMAPSDYVMWLERHQYEFYGTLKFGMFDGRETNLSYSDTDVTHIRAMRLPYGLVHSYPIPSKRILLQ